MARNLPGRKPAPDEPDDVGAVGVVMSDGEDESVPEGVDEPSGAVAMLAWPDEASLLELDNARATACEVP